MTMRIKLTYIEGEHDTVPGILRWLAADKITKDRHLTWIKSAGGKAYTEELEVELSNLWSTLEMEAALCVWEWLCDITVNTDEPHPAWQEYREGIGSAELRHESMLIGKFVLQVYNLTPDWWRETGSYDWELVPAIVSTLTPGQTSRDPQEALQELFQEPRAKQEYLRSFNWHLKLHYGIESGFTDEEFFTRWYDPQVAPEQQVKAFAEKYDLETVA